MRLAGDGWLRFFQEMDGCAPLYIAAKKGHASATKQLIEAGCNVDLQAKDGWTPLGSHVLCALIIK